MIAAFVRLPVASPARSAMIEAFQLTPVTPSALLPRAAIVPATWVPCSFASIGLLSFCTKSQPRTSSTRPLWSWSPPPGGSFGFDHMFGARSGWLYATPESITATSVCWRPVVTSHAAGAEMSGRP